MKFVAHACIAAALLTVGCGKEEPVSNRGSAGPGEEPTAKEEAIPVVQTADAERAKSAIVPKETIKKVQVDVEAEEVTVKFEFTNTSKKPVRLVDLDSNCACLSAETSKKVYGPGEKGVLTARFDLGDRAGVHRKAVHMTTGEPGNPYVRFEVEVQIPEVLLIEPRELKWEVGDPLETKALEIEIVGDDPIHVTEVDITRPKHFDFELKEIKKGREYRVEMTPKTTDDIVIGMLRIETDSKFSKYQRRSGFFSVKKPRPEKE